MSKRFQAERKHSKVPELQQKYLADCLHIPQPNSFKKLKEGKKKKTLLLIISSSPWSTCSKKPADSAELHSRCPGGGERGLLHLSLMWVLIAELCLALLIFSFKLAILLLQRGLSVFSTNGL